MIRFRRFIVFAIAVLLATGAVAQEQNVRVATYNIKFLSTNVSTQGDRLSKLKNVIALLDADVIGLQEIADRAALQLLFPAQDWHIVIDDESSDNQDVALAVRKPLRVLGVNADLDADDSNFLFSDPADNVLFPNRRDALSVEVGFPTQDETFFVIVLHMKSRVGGRGNTDPQREGAAQKLVGVLKQQFSERDFIVLGDFNDNPDDKSLNILETGDADATGGAEELDGPFLKNLVEPLLADGHVSHGRTAGDITGNRVNTIDATSRERNNDARGTNQNTGDILFDQILIPMWMENRYVANSAKIFDDEVGVRGTDADRASDHLPVFAEFVFGADEPEQPIVSGLRIVSLLPNPHGIDAGKEEAIIANPTAAAATVAGWGLRDRAGNTFALTGSVSANSRLTILLPPNSVPLNNDGDDLSLIDPQNQIKHRVTYTGAQAQSGQRITFQ
jgi:endonuclease/exonuclease/phosphatase family metal-dependent hydrolase